ncbi:MAG: RagB/SusD family nutrient uptake outer membrane protein [Labilibaculum sp.]|nr:RagB/SusD family nutrient uptake outer membrane protein [Labilibaculum sp.]
MKKILYILIATLVFTSCSSDFVEIAPVDDLNSLDFYKSKDDFNSAVIATYAKMQSQVGDIYFEMSEWRSDNLDLASPTSGTQDRFNINKFVETSANSEVNSAWANCYHSIFRCNVITDQIGGVDFDTSLKKQYEAEARFIRAFNYFNIVRLWGKAPIVLTQISPEESLTIVRSPVNEVYEAIEADLEFASQNLPNSYSYDDFGRATSGAAKALLGKVLLTEKKYSEAITILTDLIGEYSLLNNVADVFDPSNKTNNEIIFSIRFDNGIDGEGHGLWFGLSDISISSFTQKLQDAYELADSRKALLDYQAVGGLFAPGKFVDAEDAGTKKYGNDYILLRYADVLLMLSEAINEQAYTTSGNAYTYLNDVRGRAGFTTPLTSVDLSDQTSFRNAILQERFLEFPLEEHRWFDLLRMGAATSEIKSGIGVDIFTTQLLYPVPQSEVEKINDDSIFPQNNGY